MSTRPSRQEFVISPRAANLRFILTACGCACAGFGLVWGGLMASGMLRRVPRATDTNAVLATQPAPGNGSAIDPTSDTGTRSTFEPAVFPADIATNVLPSADSGLSNQPLAAASLGASRYAGRGGFGGNAGTPPEPVVSRRPFPSGVMPAMAVEPLDSPTEEQGPLDPLPADQENDSPNSEMIDDPATPPRGRNPIRSGRADDKALDGALDALPAGDDLADTDFAPLPADSAANDSELTAPPADEPLPDSTGNLLESGTDDTEPLPEDPGDLDAGSPVPFPPLATPLPAAAPQATPLPVPPAARLAPSPVHPYAAAAPTGPPPTTGRMMPAARAAPHSRASGFTDSGFDHDPEAPIPVHALPNQPPLQATSGMPFAAAPAIGPTTGPGNPDSFPTSTRLVSSAQGRPGAMQLEGVQTPQLAVEKRGPREIQVGKTARFEILVRNVGSAVANDVVLRDTVPFGTSLVATTPPATPTGAPPGQAATGELVWLLGSLPPGGQARVALDLMPTTEGDVGSVASVSFRADASVRSRATRPALEISAEVPAPVLVGRDSRMTITVSNPGSGAATGVVLEGIVPEGLVHRAGRELEFDVGSLPPGESRTIDLVLASTGPGVHDLRLMARADGQIEVEATVKVAITAPTLDLAVQMPLRRYLQRPATCVLSMTNAGTAPAVGVELAAQLPPGMKFVRANNAGYYEERTHRVLWSLEELPAAETGEVEMVVMPIALGAQKIVVAARTAAGLSDQVAHTVEVEGLAALTFDVADSEDPIEVGGVSEYLIRVGNQGTKPASGVRVVATLLGDMEPVDASGPSPHRVNNLTVSFEPLAKLAPSEEALYRIRVRGRREGDQRVQVQLTSDEQPAPITKEEITRVYADR
ncbi:MAG: DUF11 domain-containing protein [Planctomycetota bacterium]|nr:MAG: DUF11 domain-containing protein [Planctomycetota bacterium]